MPLLLKRRAIQLLQSGSQTLYEAVTSFGRPTPPFIDENSKVDNKVLYAPVMGMCGVAAELGMAGCLVQARGDAVLTVDSSHYKSSKEILDEFSNLIRNPTPRSEFLTAGVETPDDHLDELDESTQRFRALRTQRAAALHGGKGPVREEVMTVTLHRVADFYKLLAKSDKISPYVPNPPRPAADAEEKVVLLEELTKQLEDESGLEGKERTLSALILISPELPDESPEWFDRLDSMVARPSEEDVQFLTERLVEADVGKLKKAVGGDSGISATIDSDNPAALPIEIHSVKRELRNLDDQWDATVGVANGRLSDGELNLPSADFVRKVFAKGLESTDIPRPSGAITAQQTWPFVMASLEQQGTPGPYWFLIRACSDLDALRGFLDEAFPLASGYAQRRENAFRNGLDAIQEGQALDPYGTGRFEDLIARSQEAQETRRGIDDAIDRAEGTYRELSEDLQDTVRQVSNEELGVASAIAKFLESETDSLGERGRGYWCSKLCEAATEDEDVAPVFAVLNNPSLKRAHTAARKAIELIDFLGSGPDIQTP